MRLHYLNDVANDAKSTQNIDHYVIFASLKSESTLYADKYNTRCASFDIKFSRIGFQKAC